MALWNNALFHISTIVRTQEYGAERYQAENIPMPEWAFNSPTLRDEFAVHNSAKNIGEDEFARDRTSDLFRFFVVLKNMISSIARTAASALN